MYMYIYILIIYWSFVTEQTAYIYLIIDYLLITIVNCIAKILILISFYATIRSKYAIIGFLSFASPEAFVL